MSAFLGPIHTWLYKKIKFQNGLTEEIIKTAEENNAAADILNKLNDKYENIESGNLEDIIDESNIHGWLQQRITVVENRLSYVIHLLTEKNVKNIDLAYKAAYEFGKKYRVDLSFTPKEAYRALEDILLNGMPCDRVNEVIAEDEDKVVWRQTKDIHESYWNENNADLKYYYEIRKNLINGVISDTDLVYQENFDQIFELRRK